MDKSSSRYRTAMLKVVGDHAIDFTSAIFGDLLRRLFPLVEEGDWHSNQHILPFVFTSAAALEATLNDHLVAHCFDIHGPESYKRHAESILTLSLRAKLDFVVPFLTSNKFRIRDDSTQYGALRELIQARNQLTHSKSFFLDGVKWGMGDDDLEIPEKIKDKLDKARVRSVNAHFCKRVFGALNGLDECFFFPQDAGNLEANELVESL